MAIISGSDTRSYRRYGGTQFRFALTYVAITVVVLLFLNIYCTKTSQELFYKSKKASMIEKCQLTAAEIANLEIINTDTVSTAVSKIGSLKATRLIITDQSGVAVYDSLEDAPATGSYLLFPEIAKSLTRYDVFTWQYHAGAMRSQAAVPIMDYGSVIGCVYIMDLDVSQGALILSLQKNLFTITLFLELVVILFSVFFSHTFSRRLRRIVTSIRIIREGDYSHTVVMGGHDELTVLGNEFNALTEKLQTSENKRRQFVSDASHELKTPLASIKLLSDSILQNDMDMETVREFVGDIGNEAERLNRMSLKLLSLSRIESQSDGDCEIILMTPTIQRVIHMLSGIARETNIDICLDSVQDSPILVLEDDLYQIVFNLVENGIKYNTPGGKLNVTLDRLEDNAVIRISDTGVGIPQESLSHIFERFYRVDKARARKTGGSGLGLSIVRNMVERNSGVITVESAEGRGTTFTVTFPIFDTEDDPE